MLLSVEFVGQQALLGKMRLASTNVMLSLERTVTKLALQLERRVKDKLQDDVLHIRTGQLHASIFHEVEVSSTQVVGKVAAPKRIPYAAIHEFGGTINVPEIVPRSANALHWIGSDGKDVFAMRAAPHAVKMPQRSYMRSSLAEMETTIREQLREAVITGTGL